jgi:hypothetical protein
MIHTHTCITLACDKCARDYDDDYTMHFDAVDTARRHAEAAGWTVTGDRILCADCAARTACTLTCHTWGPWFAVDQGRYGGNVRVCTCDTADYDPLPATADYRPPAGGEGRGPT